MKIYNKLVLNIETGETLYEDSFDYTGPLALCKGGTPAPVQPTATELALQDEQLSMLKEQRASEKEMEPFALESMGYARGEDGKITKITTAESILNKKNLALAGFAEDGTKLTEAQQLEAMTEAEKMNYNLSKAANERQAKALAGTLDISPALEQSLTAEETQAQEMLARKLGKDWSLSTSGQNLMKNIQEKNNLIREEARTGLITGLEGVTASKSAITDNDAIGSLNLAGTFSNSATDKINRMMGYSGSKTAAWNTTMDMSNKLEGQRTNLQNYQQANAQNKSAQRQGTTSAVMAGIGTAAAVAAAAV